MRKGTSDGSLKPEIRTAREEDLAALLSLEEICFKEETFNEKQVRYLLHKAKSIVLVAAIEEKIIGSIIVLIRNNISHARIYSLNVHPLYRRSGIGSSLMDAAIKLLKEKGFRKITLEAGINNRAARRLYKSRGFVADKILRNYYKDGCNAFHFVKIL